MRKRCSICKFYKWEYDWRYEWSERRCKHPKRREIEWDAGWGFIEDCPFWEPNVEVEEE